MYSALSFFRSYITAKELRSYSFLFLAIAMLSASIAAVHGTFDVILVFAIFASSMVVPFLGARLRSYPILLNHQIFYVLPLLISVSLSMKFDFLDYILQFVVLGCSAVLCASEIAKISEESEKKTNLLLQAGVSLVALIFVSYFLVVVPGVTKLASLIIAISICFLLESPVRKKLKFHPVEYKGKIKMTLLAAGIAAIYGYISFFGSNFIAYFLYIGLAVNLGFCFREDKVSFFVFSIMLLLASLIPFGPVEKYVDNVVLTGIIMLFHLKSPILHYKKTVYGELRVEYSYRNNKISLISDSIIHGEKVVGVDNKKINLRYFGTASENSAISSVFNIFNKKDSKIAVLGLGAGTLAMLGGEKNTIEFYEINPEIVKIAYDRTLFNYLSESDSTTSVIMGDARVELSKAEEKKYDLIVIDVYLGDDVPDHFFTKEAVEMYMKKLTKDGVITFHVANRDYEDFENKISNIAKKLGLESIIAYEKYADNKEEEDSSGLLVMPQDNSLKGGISRIISKIIGRHESDYEGEEVYGWLVLSKNKSSINHLIEEKRWFPLKSKGGSVLYSDESIGYKQHSSEITQEVD